LLEAVAAAVDGTAFALWAARDPLAYPLANVVHVLGAVMLVGAIGIVDLRLLGAFRALPEGPLVKALSPIGVFGLLLMLASGSVLFAADAPALATSGVFRWKLILVLVGIVNALAFRALLARAGGRIGAGARLLALLSLSLWLAVLVLGRWIAYA
jgi:hypothetical protein